MALNDNEVSDPSSRRGPRAAGLAGATYPVTNDDAAAMLGAVAFSRDDYLRWLDPLCASVDVWETIYLQRLPARADGEHPVVAFVSGTWLNPYLERLAGDDAARTAFLAEYRERNTDVVAAHGGRFIARGGPHEVLEGDWNPLRLVVIEFPDMDAARVVEGT